MDSNVLLPLSEPWPHPKNFKETPSIHKNCNGFQCSIGSFETTDTSNKCKESANFSQIYNKSLS